MNLKDFFLTEAQLKDIEGPVLSEEAKNGFLRLVATYAEYGKRLERSHSLSEIAKELGTVANAAEAFTMNEADDWFDQVTIKRNMKELKKFNEEFIKTSQDAIKLENRMNALFDDMGHVLGRYFEIKDLSEHADALEEARIIHGGPERISEINVASVKKLAKTAWFKNLLGMASKFGDVLVYYTDDGGEDEWDVISHSKIKQFKSHFRNFNVIFDGKTKDWVIK